MSQLIVILGPTGVGKTDISFRLAERFDAPIISSDSRQIYKGLKIGTAAPTDEELKRIKHYFIGELSIFDYYSAGQYERDAIELIEKLFKTHNILLLVGGSMMYIDAVCKGFDEVPKIDDETRQFWKKEHKEKGLHFLQEELKRLDPEHYSKVDLQNYKRVIRALEVCTMTGQSYSSLRKGVIKERNFDILKIGLNRPRPELYERINSRVDKMVENGLVEEAKLFYPHKNLNSLNTVGYKEFFKHFDGECSLEESISLLKRDTRQYAKRQLTWFNRDEDIHWFNPDNEEEIISFIDSKLSFK